MKMKIVSFLSLFLILSVSFSADTNVKTTSDVYSIFGFELPVLPYPLIFAGLALILTLGKLIKELDDIMDEDNRRRFPLFAFEILALIYLLIQEGYIGEGIIQIYPAGLILAVGFLFLSIANAMDVFID